MHKCSLVHRDIKPSNIVFVKGAPQLADVGLVTETDEAHSFVGTEGWYAAHLKALSNATEVLSLAATRDRWAASIEAGTTNRWLLATGDQGAQVAVWDLHECQRRSSWQ